MSDELFTLQIPVADKVIRTILVYGAIVLLFRLTGKRGLSQLNTFDFVVIFLLSNVVQNAVIGPDNSVTGGLIGAVTLMVISNVLDALIARSPRAARVLEGRPTTVISDGRPRKKEIRRLALRRQDLDQAVRLQDGESVNEVASGVLEPSGHLAVRLKPEFQSATKHDIDLLLARLTSIEERLARGGR